MKGAAFMRFLEPEPPAPIPDDFEAFVEELGLVADELGVWAVIGCYWRASDEACRALVARPVIWQGLIARARYADKRRFETGVTLGRRDCSR
jgi:hypothetical protein